MAILAHNGSKDAFCPLWRKTAYGCHIRGIDMNDFPRFDYRMKSDHTIEVICAVCRKEVGVTNDEFFLQTLEDGHRCDEALHLPRAS
jgi:uncharacterized CHY-type Zn-finger protein